MPKVANVSDKKREAKRLKCLCRSIVLVVLSNDKIVASVESEASFISLSFTREAVPPS